MAETRIAGGDLMRPVGGTLVGRDAECRGVDGILAAARAGHGGALLLEGEAGIGKTSLLAYAVSQARDMQVLSARGYESETELPFSGLSDVLHPLADELSRLPARQAAALAGALGVGPPVHGDRFAVAAATLALLAAAAVPKPILVVVDDLQWLDPASAEALLFATRRLEGEPVAVILARSDGWGRHPGREAIPVLELEGLDRAASADLVARVAGMPAAEAVVDHLHPMTRGNPMALIAAAEALTPAQIEGREALEPTLPAGGPIEDAVAAKVGELPAVTREALLLASASGSRDLEVVIGGLRELGLNPDALDPAELEGFIAVDDAHIDFRHPLVRSCVYQGSPSAQRRSVHAALARALSRRGDEWTDLRAWHLAAATAEPDEAVAAELEIAALGASRRSGYWAAARGFERAAHLSPDPESKARRLVSAAEAWDLAGRADRAIPVLDEAAQATRDPLALASIDGLRVRFTGRHGHAIATSGVRAASPPSEPDEAVGRLAASLHSGGLPGHPAGDLAIAVEAGWRALRLAEPLGGTPLLLAEVRLGAALVLTGDTATGYPLLMRCAELLSDPDPRHHAAELAECGPALLAAGEASLARELLQRVADACRASGAAGLLPYVMGALAEVDARLGAWELAEASAFESVHLARATHQDTPLSHNLARLARFEAVLGHEESCRSHAAEAVDLATARGFGPTFVMAASALGLLELGLGRPDAAVGHLEEASRWWSHVGFGHPGRLLWQQDLAEALIRSGHLDRAAEVVDSLEAAVAASALPGGEGEAGRPRGGLASAGVARCRGLMASEDELDAWFAAALGVHDAWPAPFERARTACAFGEQLRRHGRRVDARVQLRSALDAFEHLGAAPWARRARAELAATGETAGSTGAAADEADGRLTPQELQVAMFVARGATNKEAAAALFLTPKTVEFHLSQIYRKLGLRSRTELAHRLAEPPGAEVTPTSEPEAPRPIPAGRGAR